MTLWRRHYDYDTTTWRRLDDIIIYTTRQQSTQRRWLWRRQKSRRRGWRYVRQHDDNGIRWRRYDTTLLSTGRWRRWLWRRRNDYTTTTWTQWYRRWRWHDDDDNDDDDHDYEITYSRVDICRIVSYRVVVWSSCSGTVIVMSSWRHPRRCHHCLVVVIIFLSSSFSCRRNSHRRLYRVTIVWLKYEIGSIVFHSSELETNPRCCPTWLSRDQLQNQFLWIIKI